MVCSTDECMMKDVAYLLVPIVGVPVERSGFSDVENGGSSRGLLNHESILAAGRAQNENTKENARTPAQAKSVRVLPGTS